MSAQRAKVLEDALSLSPAERAELVDELLASLDSPARRRIDQLWAQEAEGRLDAFDRGEIKTVSAKQVFEELDRRKTDAG